MNDRDGVGHDDQWYAIQVLPRREWSVCSILTHKGYDVFLPLSKASRRWSDRIKVVDIPLFPGYLFCKIDRSIRYPIVHTQGVIGVVGQGGRWDPVAPAEIDAVRKLVSCGAKAQSWPFLKEGDTVRIEWGPMRGLEGLLLKLKDGIRLVVSVTLLQRSVAVEIDRLWIRPV